MSERRYGEREVAEILRAAAESQANESISGSEGPGLTLAQIQRLASEVGIDERHVALAASVKTGGRGPSVRRGFWGGPGVIRVERTYSGTIDDAAWEDVVSELRALIGSPGTVSQVGLSREWTAWGTFVGMHFRAKPEGDRTKLEVTMNQFSGLFVLWMAAFIASFVLSILASVWWGSTGRALEMIFTLLTVVIGGSYLTARHFAGNITRKNQLRVDEMLSRIENIVPKPVASSETRTLPIEEAPVRLQSGPSS